MFEISAEIVKSEMRFRGNCALCLNIKQETHWS